MPDQDAAPFVLAPPADETPAKQKRKAAPKKPRAPKAELDEAAILDGAPREGSTTRLFWDYAHAFARGMSRATGKPCTAPTVKGPTDILIRLMRAHGRNDANELLRGADVLAWLETTALEFRSTADERRV